MLLHNTFFTNAAILDELLTKWEKMGDRFGTLGELLLTETTASRGIIKAKRLER